MRFFQFEAVEHNHQNTRFLASKARMFQQLPNFCLIDMFRCHCFSYSKLSICLLEFWYYNKCSVVSRDHGSISSCLSKKQFLKNSYSHKRVYLPKQWINTNIIGHPDGSNLVKYCWSPSSSNFNPLN